MINASELRIGNWVKCKVSNDAGFYQVERVGGWIRNWATKKKESFVDERLIKICGGARNGEEYPESKLAPVVITPEILQKGGFTWSGGDHWATKDNSVWIEDYQGFYRLCRPIFAPTKTKDLHQIQNLYFALTNEELEINL